MKLWKKFPGLLALATVLVACAGQAQRELPVVTASFETEPVVSDDDAADDPAILVSADTSVVRILGTDKQAGLGVYDLDGRLLAFLESGRLNNVDAVSLGDDRFLVAASNRTLISIDLFLADLRADEIRFLNRIPLELSEPYGLCMGLTPEPTVFVGDKDGRVEQWRVTETGQGEQVGDLSFSSQTEGCVYDAETNVLYVGEEMVGIWAVSLDSGARRPLDATGQGRLTADVEGLDVYQRGEAKYLIASSQGDNSYVVYELPSGTPLVHFRIDDDLSEGLDGTEETDGIAVTGTPLAGYPLGLLVVQDGYNRSPRENQNFKGVDWQRVQALIEAQTAKP